MVNFADRVSMLRPSAARQLIRFTAQPSVISFAGGKPAPELFPVEELRQATEKVFDTSATVALQYGETEGLEHLREQIAERIGRINGIKTDAEHIICTAGSQQAIDFIAKLYLNPGDVVVMESPSYFGAINAFLPYQPKFVEVPTDEHGMIMEELDRILATTENVKLIYVIPDFQNPSGRTWPVERRKAFMEIVNRYEIPVIEDNPYGELYFTDSVMPSLKSFDEKELVMYLGSFSKILAPGFRVGWVCTNDNDRIANLNMIEQAASLQPSTMTEMIISTYIDMFDLDVHVETVRQSYKRRAALMIQEMEKTFPQEAKFTKPDGGLFTWTELPENVNTLALLKKAFAMQMAFIPGRTAFPNLGNNHCMRLNYSCSTDEQIVTGIDKLADLIKDNL